MDAMTDGEMETDRVLLGDAPVDKLADNEAAVDGVTLAETVALADPLALMLSPMRLAAGETLAADDALAFCERVMLALNVLEAEPVAVTVFERDGAGDGMASIYTYASSKFAASADAAELATSLEKAAVVRAARTHVAMEAL